jgi:hypothetical protein
MCVSWGFCSTQINTCQVLIPWHGHKRHPILFRSQICSWLTWWEDPGCSFWGSIPCHVLELLRGLGYCVFLGKRADVVLAVAWSLPLRWDFLDSSPSLFLDAAPDNTRTPLIEVLTAPTEWARVSLAAVPKPWLSDPLLQVPGSLWPGLCAPLHPVLRGLSSHLALECLSTHHLPTGTRPFAS